MDQELICRTCFTKTTRCLSIFAEFKLWDKVISLYKMIMACAPVEISVTDGFPSKICENCLTKLQYSFLFRMQILQADIKLKNYARKTRVFYSNSAIRDFLPEPILKDAKSNLQEIYSLDQILQSLPLLNANIFDNDEFNKSSNENKLKIEPIKNEITEFIDEMIVISDEDVRQLKTEKQICSMESNKVHVVHGQEVKIEMNSSPLHDETVVNPDILPSIVTCNENNEIQIVPTPQIYCDDLSVTYNKLKTGVTYNKPSVSSVMNSTNDCNAINTNNILLDQTVSISSVQNTIFRDNADAILSSLINKYDPNRGKTLDTIKNVADDQSQVNETSDKLQKTSMYPTDARPLYEQNRSTCGKQSSTKGLSLVIKRNINEKVNNLEGLEIPNKNLNLVQRVNVINTKIKNIAGEKNDRSRTILINAKSLKTGLDSIHECNNIEIKSTFKNKTIHTRTKKNTSKTETNKPSQVQIVANSSYKYPTNPNFCQKIPANNNTVVAANQTKNEQKLDKNSVISKDERNNGQNSHLSRKINLTNQITPVTSSVSGKACEISSSHTKNCVLAQKNCSNLIALAVDDFKIIGNKTDAYSTFKLYKIPTNTLHESTVINSIKQGNDISVSNTSNLTNVKYQIASIKQDNATLINKRIPRSNSGSSTLSQSCVKSSVKKYANNLKAINVKNSKQENTTITKTDLQQNLQVFKRKGNHKVYFNKRKKYI